MGGGILPVAYYKGNIYFLFGREFQYNRYYQRLWSDFGGSREKNETQYQTAVREGYEESNGILGDMKNIRLLIKNFCLAKIGDKGWSTYLIQVKYNKEIIKLFRADFKQILKHNPQIVKSHNGLYEKDKIKWIKLQDLKKNIHIFRPWYRKFIYKIINYFQE